MKGIGQFINSGFHRKLSLRCPISTISTGLHRIGVYDIIGKTTSFDMIVQRQGLMTA